MSEKRHVPPAPVDDYFDARPLLRHIRVMERVMEWVDDDPRTRAFFHDLHGAYMDVLSKELAPHALTLALALTQLENAFPEIAALVKHDGREE